jgi:peptidoglycan/xylan/chitin deacetylase (PgdA/CDA1 family)
MKKRLFLADARPTLDGVLARSPAQTIAARWNADRPCILAYHGIEDPVRFEAHAAYLRETRQPIGATDALAALSSRRPLPNRAILVTFDDGDRSVYDQGAPILKRYGIPAIVFVIADLIDSDRPAWFQEVPELIKNGGSTRRFQAMPPRALVANMKKLPENARREVIEELRGTARMPAAPVAQLKRAELRALESMGVEIGNHTLTHPCLDQCSGEKVEAEIVGAHTRLTEILGHPPRTFAYPNGNFNPVAAEILRGLGYEAAFLFDHRIGRFPPDEVMRISRVRVDSTTPLDRFRITLSGLHPAIHRFLHRG